MDKSIIFISIIVFFAILGSLKVDNDQQQSEENKENENEGKENDKQNN